VHFIDVGQGDAILIDLEDTEVLIDGGDRAPGVVSYLKGCVDGPLELMIATHPHADHIGGLIDVLAAFEVLEIWHNGDTATSKAYIDFMAAVKAENARVFQAVRGNTIEADGLAFRVLHPENLQGTANNNSIVLYLAFGEIDFLFAGDAEQEAEASMLSAGLIPDVEILKVGHHGSRTASSQAFLAKAKPEFAIYMAGAGNSYGHPHSETIASLNQIGANILGTDTYGTVIVVTDGKSMSVETHKGGTTAVPATQKSTPIGIDLDAEIVVTKNTGNVVVDMTGWKPVSEVGDQEFMFPKLALQPG
jgi:competence protein ComEC